MKLTKKNVESLEPTGTRYEVRDDELIGFSIRVGATGEKSFYLTYRAGKGRAAPLKRLRIGTFPSMTVEQARQIVKQKLAQIAMGGDPAQEVKEGKNAPLFHEVLETFLQEHVDAVSDTCPKPPDSCLQKNENGRYHLPTRCQAPP